MQLWQCTNQCLMQAPNVLPYHLHHHCLQTQRQGAGLIVSAAEQFCLIASLMTGHWAWTECEVAQWVYCCALGSLKAPGGTHHPHRPQLCQCGGPQSAFHQYCCQACVTESHHDLGRHSRTQQALLAPLSAQANLEYALSFYSKALERN